MHPFALSRFDGRKSRPDKLLPCVDHAEVTKVSVQLSACGRYVQIESGSDQRRRVRLRRDHGVQGRASRAAGIDPLADQFTHELDDCDVGFTVEPMTAWTVTGRTHAVA